MGLEMGRRLCSKGSHRGWMQIDGTVMVLHLLRRYLGEYVHGLSAEALRISVWNVFTTTSYTPLGDVEGDGSRLLLRAVPARSSFLVMLGLKINIRKCEITPERVGNSMRDGENAEHKGDTCSYLGVPLGAFSKDHAMRNPGPGKATKGLEHLQHNSSWNTSEGSRKHHLVNWENMYGAESGNGLFTVSSYYKRLLVRGKDGNADHLLLHCNVANRLWMVALNCFSMQWVMPDTVKDTLQRLESRRGKRSSRAWSVAPLAIMFSSFGDVVLKDLKLKAEALNLLKLPVTVTAGFVGTITLQFSVLSVNIKFFGNLLAYVQVPWKSLGKEPVIVLIDRVFILAHPVVDGRSLKEAESATLEALSRSKLGSPPAGNSWLGSLIGTIIGNLKISITNVHVRYEDSVSLVDFLLLHIMGGHKFSNPGHPFSCGVTLAKLAAVTMDEQGNETFDTSGALDKLRKVQALEIAPCGNVRVEVKMREIMVEVGELKRIEAERELILMEKERKVRLKMELKELALAQVISWRQKSKASWLEEGDSNTKFFHHITVANRRNFIEFV
ncbi:hypothetical protein FXO37_04600 [Capsicum annuum]|nr:hypothetical protein FXO37_04600 [Capsicum annuum]